MRHRAALDLPPAPLSIYRRSSVVMLRRYFQMSVELGRLPALLGREFFRSRVDSIHDAWFEDAVIYVHDVERCLDKLHHFDRQVIARVVLQEYTHEDAARLLGCAERHLRRRLAIALDVLSQLFLDRNLMVLAKPRRSEQIVEEISAADELAARCCHSVSQRNECDDNAWRSLPVEISCQAPCASQILATC